MGDLQRLQEFVYALVTAPERVPEAMARQGFSEADVAARIRGDARASAVGRLSVYANMYFLRIRDVLAEQFPFLHAALGERDFDALVVSYLARFAPSNPSLRNVGADLAEFLLELERPTWLSELALLEWTRVDLFDGPDTEQLQVEDVRRMDPASLGDLPIRMVPNMRLLRVAHRVDRFEPGTTPEPGVVNVLVWRRGLDVTQRAADDVEADILSMCGASPTLFGAVCDRLIELVGEESATERAFALLVQWLADGLVQK